VFSPILVENACFDAGLRLSEDPWSAPRQQATTPQFQMKHHSPTHTNVNQHHPTTRWNDHAGGSPPQNSSPGGERGSMRYVSEDIVGIESMQGLQTRLVRPWIFSYGPQLMPLTATALQSVRRRIGREVISNYAQRSLTSTSWIPRPRLAPGTSIA